MPEGFCFLFLFDYRSVFRRKNPLGLVEAFCAAFEPGSGPSLVIKSICGDEFPAERQELAAAVADRPDIHLIEDDITSGMKNAMIAACDCYVSLHRSEGLGLTMAEAMYFGKAGDRHRLLRQPRLHDRAEQLSRAPHDGRDRPRRRPLPGRTRIGPSRTSTKPRS